MRLFHLRRLLGSLLRRTPSRRRVRGRCAWVEPLEPRRLLALTAGDIAVIDWQSEDEDGASGDYLTLLPLVPISAGETFYFTDTGVKSDGTLRTVADGNFEDATRFVASRDYSAFEQIVFERQNPDGQFATYGSIFTSNIVFESPGEHWDAGSSGDQAIIFVDSDPANGTEPALEPTFIYGLFTDGTVWDDDATSGTTSAEPPGLGAASFAFGQEPTKEWDSIVYTGPTNFGDKAHALAEITDVNNWYGTDESDDSTYQRWKRLNRWAFSPPPTDTVTATKHDTLVVDNDGDGVADPSDTIQYEVIIDNPTGTNADGVQFVDTLRHVTLVDGSVQVTPGGTDNSTNQLVDVDIGTLSAGQEATIRFRTTIDNLAPGFAPPISNQGRVITTNLGRVDTDDPETGTSGDATVTQLDTLSLGDVVFLDNDFDGLFGAADTPIDDVLLNLFVDDGSGEFEPGSDPFEGQVYSSAGTYGFDNLAPGDYIVQIDAGNFAPGGPLAGFSTFPDPAADPDNDVDHDDNGQYLGEPLGVVSRAVTLAYDAEPSADDGDPNTNLTVDFAFDAFERIEISGRKFEDKNANGRDDLSPGIRQVGSMDTPDQALAVEVARGLAYIADGASGLRIVNVSDPAAPSDLGSFDTPGFAQDVQVVGDLAYVADAGGGLQIVDVSDPAAPAVAGSFVTPDAATKVHVVGDLAYVADLNNGLLIVDVSNPSSPAAVGGIDTPGTALAVQVLDDLAYLADGYYGLKIVDVSNPAAPVLLGELDTPGLARNLHVLGDLVFVADFTGGLQIINVVDPAAPIAVGSFAASDAAMDVTVLGNLAYLANDSHGLQIVDVSDPANPAAVAGFDTPDSALDVHVFGELAYLANDESGLQILDVSDPARLAGSVATPGTAWDLHVVGDVAYVADGSSGLQIVDVSDPVAPAPVASFDTPGSARDVEVSAGRAFVADGTGGLQIVDVTNFAAPEFLGSFDTPDFAWKLHVMADVVYVADGNAGLQIVDVTDPAAPMLVGSFATAGQARDVQVTAGLAYVAVGTGGLQIVDVSDPAAPAHVGGFDTPGTAIGVHVSENLAYIADGSSGLRILDVGDPAAPAAVGSFNTPHLAFDIHVADGFAYLADGNTGLQILDVNNPAAPTLAGGFDTPGSVRGVQALDHLAYIADFDGGLFAVNVREPGLAGVTIELWRDGGDLGADFGTGDDLLTASAVSGALGRYHIPDVGRGTFYLRELAPATGVQTTVPLHYTITTASGVDVPLRDFGNYLGQDRLTVTGFANTTWGFVVDFSRTIHPEVLSLYDVEAGTLGPADVTLVGAAGGPVAGSLVVEGPRLIFVATGGPLPPDDYAVTLRSDVDAIHDLGGELLDGDQDGLAGGDYGTAFRVDGDETAPRLTLPDFSRGPGQDVAVPATAQGIPLTLSDSGGVTRVDFKLRYDPRLLNVTGVTSLPIGWTQNVDLTAPGLAIVSLQSAQPLTAGEQVVGEILADVPASAEYTAAAVLTLDDAEVERNSIALAVDAEGALQVVAYLGDVTANGSYSGLDASYIARNGVGLDAGFLNFPAIDPVIVGDVTGNGELSGLDASQVARKGVGLDAEEIPDLPGGPQRLSEVGMRNAEVSGEVGMRNAEVGGEVGMRNAEVGMGDAETPQTRIPHSAFRIPNLPSFRIPQTFDLSIVREISERNGASHRFREEAFPLEKPAASALPLTGNLTPISRPMLFGWRANTDKDDTLPADIFDGLFADTDWLDGA